jgi:hypothetical protein
MQSTAWFRGESFKCELRLELNYPEHVYSNLVQHVGMQSREFLHT